MYDFSMDNNLMIRRDRGLGETKLFVDRSHVPGNVCLAVLFLYGAGDSDIGLPMEKQLELTVQ